MSGVDVTGKIMLSRCRDHVFEMEKLARELEPAPGGIYPSEMLLACSLCRHLRADLIVESGRCHGYSTEVFANFFPETPIISIDIDPPMKTALKRLKHYENIDLVTCDGCEMAPAIHAADESRVFVLLDGPKYHRAMRLSRILFEMDLLTEKRIVCVCIHDVRDWPFSTFWSCSFSTQTLSNYENEFRYLDATFLEKLGYSPSSPGVSLAALLKP